MTMLFARRIRAAFVGLCLLGVMGCGAGDDGGTNATNACDNPALTGENCDQCVDLKFAGEACDECADPKFSGEACDQCADQRFSGGACDQCADAKFSGESTLLEAL